MLSVVAARYESGHRICAAARTVVVLAVTLFPSCAERSNPLTPTGGTAEDGEPVQTFRSGWIAEDRFTAEVIELTALSDYKGRAVVAHFDPHWILVVRRAGEDGRGLVGHERVEAYAIHSPVKLLAVHADRAVGRRFRFVVSRRDNADGSVRRLLVVQRTATP